MCAAKCPEIYVTLAHEYRILLVQNLKPTRKGANVQSALYLGSPEIWMDWTQRAAAVRRA
jgi:hypothetical protein